MAQVDTEELINAAIDARAAREQQRQEIAARRGQIVRQLATMPGGRRTRGQMASLQAELGSLGATERNLNAQERADQQNTALRAHTAFQNAHLATQAAKDARDAQVANESARIQNGIVRLQARYPNRITDTNQATQFHNEMEKLTTENAMGMRNASTAAAVRQASEFHDQQRQKAIDKAAANLGALGVNPNDFIQRDRSKDFATNLKTLAEVRQASGGDVNKGGNAAQGKPGAAGVDTGDYVHFMAGGQQHLVKKSDFAQWNALFAPQQPIGESAPVPLTPDQQAQEAGYRSAAQVQQFQQTGKLALPPGVVAAGGSPTPEAQALTAARSKYLEQNPQASTVAGGGVLGAGGVQPNLPANLQPTGINQIGTPATDQGIARGTVSLTPTAPAQQPAPTTQNPTETLTPAQVAAAPTLPPQVVTPTEAAPQPTPNLPGVNDTRVVNGNTFRWNGTRWEPQ